MQILLIFYRKIKRFNKLSFRDKLVCIKVFILTGIFRVIILTIPFNQYKNYMGIHNIESSKELEGYNYEKATKIKWIIESISKNTPWDSNCLVKSLTAQYILCHENIDSTLYLGVSNEEKLILRYNEKSVKKLEKGQDKMVAHSWIRCGNVYVTGGNGDGYGIVAKFMKEGIKNRE